MQAVEAERRQHQRNALRGYGALALQQQVWAGDGLVANHAADILALPFLTAADDLQDSSGTPLFMFGVSPWGGDDPWP